MVEAFAYAVAVCLATGLVMMSVMFVATAFAMLVERIGRNED